MKNNYHRVFASLPWGYIVCCLGAFVFSLGLPVDLDLGWHLRYGEYFYTTGHILRENIISSVWPDYTWVQASWGYDILLYPLFRMLEFPGLSVAAALTSVLIFGIITWRKRFSHTLFLIFLAILFISHTQPLFIAGLRAQTVSALFFALALWVYEEKRNRWLPLIVWLWANLHGGFVLGLGVLWVLWLGHREKRSGFWLCLASVIPILNPYGLALYRESFIHATNTSIASIGEWTPLFSSPLESTIALTVALIAAIATIVGKGKSSYTYLLVLGILTWLSQSAIRFIIPFGIFTTYLIAQAGERLGRILPRSLRYCSVAGIILIAVFDLLVSHKYFLLPDTRLIGFTWDTYCSVLGTCSEPISQKLNAARPSGNGFNTYNWGGYLSYRVPSIKTFVDGRMTAWQRNGTTPPIDDAERVTVEKDPITWRRLDSQYHFTWAIVPDQSPIAKYLHQDTKWKRETMDGMYTLFLKP